MKLKTLLVLLIINIGLLKAQNFTLSNSQSPKCFGACDGSVTYTTSSVVGPFTAAVTNPSACPNSTVQNSSNNSISVNSICACPGIYTITIYTGSVVVGSEILQFPNYATSSLVINVSSLSPETCSACCDGGAHITYTGGYITGTPTFSMDGVPVVNVSPATNLCNGSHTVCMTDAAGCIVCKTFTTSTLAGIHENAMNLPVTISPNPANDELSVESVPGNPISKVEIFDLTGRKISELVSVNRSENKLKLDVKFLNEGLYYLNVYGADGRLMQHKKFVKERN